TFPTKKGQCQQVKCPTNDIMAEHPDLYHEAGGLGLWSISGWQADGATHVTPPTSVPLPIAPTIGAINKGSPSVAVIDGRIRYNTTPTPDTVTIEGDNDTTILLIQCQPNQELYTKFFQVFEGQMNLQQLPSGLLTVPAFTPNPAGSGYGTYNAWQ